jgi:hypothetical protein
MAYWAWFISCWFATNLKITLPDWAMKSIHPAYVWLLVATTLLWVLVYGGPVIEKENK